MSEPVGTGRPECRGAALVLSASLRDQLARHAEAAYPGEACGALLGSLERSNFPTVTRAIPLRNSDPWTGDGYRISVDDLYELSPEDSSREERTVGFYHSHPDRTARPSERDLRCAIPGLLYVTVSVRAGRAGARVAWIASGAVPADADHPLRNCACQN